MVSMMGLIEPMSGWRKHMESLRGSMKIVHAVAELRNLRGPFYAWTAHVRLERVHAEREHESKSA